MPAMTPPAFRRGAPLLARDPEVVEPFLAAIRAGATLREAATAARVGASTVRRWMAKARAGDPALVPFRLAVIEAERQSPAGQARERIFQGARSYGTQRRGPR